MVRSGRCAQKRGNRIGFIILFSVIIICEPPLCVARPLVARLASARNISEYGAVCDGRNDDTEAIQKALDSNVRIVVIPISSAGCRISQTLRISRSGTTISGLGPKSTIVYKGDKAVSGAMIQADFMKSAHRGEAIHVRNVSLIAGDGSSVASFTFG